MPSSAAPIVIADSITRVAEADARGAVVVNASHGGIYAAYLAAQLGAAAAVFNDAGVGRDRAGISGLAYLQELGMPAATIGHDTARIGDGADMLARGVITHANGLAEALDCRAGMSCRNAAAALPSPEPARAAPPPAPAGAVPLIRATRSPSSAAPSPRRQTDDHRRRSRRPQPPRGPHEWRPRARRDAAPLGRRADVRHGRLSAPAVLRRALPPRPAAFPDQ